MASIADKFKKRNAKGNMSVEWSRTGTFLHKPERGWIHPDEQLASDAGICYGVRYIGCLEVKESMRSLDFDTRTALAREAINRVSEAAGLKSASKRKKVEKRISRMLGDMPCMQYAGSNVNLTITIESINLMVMESGEVIADHLMPGISFASGGDAETLDFVAYVAKDEVMGRACHVLECGGGLSEDVITTIGQAFELRFKEYLKKQPKPVHRIEHTIREDDAWGNDNDSEYYNDNPGARPPSPKLRVPSEYSSPPSNLPVSDGVYSSVREPPEPLKGAALYETAKETPLIDFGDGKNVYDNKSQNNPGEDGREESNPANRGLYDNHKLHGQQEAASNDPFDMEPFSSSISNGHIESKPPGTTAASKNISPIFEEWFHGNLSRKEAEKMLLNDGDFLVRQSSADTTQYVLSGRQNGAIKHLLLVDPEGVVRTKDHSFDSVPHLINFHRTKDIPIVSQESELHLKNPISNKLTMC
ncbi:SHC1-like protein [Mya arenaria]|uniref:SHC1-like protein n=1 Tax=Mya arenaria TaxID=6604 RepID=A0ABY7F9T8_MYAAR|nr:SHC-transforming protein 1-like [Mya arenaria]WAR18935.1 SHC1-like protein [Mya arenaria]